MDPYLAKRKALMVMLAAMLVVPVGLVVWVSGGFPVIAGWYHAADQLTQQLPVNDPKYMYDRAVEYDHDGNPAMAQAAARRATIVDPSFTLAHKFLAAEAFKSHDYETAARECRSVLLNTPSDGSAAIGLATAYDGMGQKDRAQQVYSDTMNSQAFDNMVRDRARRSLQHMIPGSPGERELTVPPPSVDDTGSQVSH